ncbi:MAG: hypothetical protein UU81_C0031G0002 [Microgenomates group bacterium GW2011_GWC1_41_8]|uniref:Uncharacterized protein n=2 Tax=Candidatus Roizmaniibacteriota TaxID=1752723 RepID=A0A0G0T9I5_9BACT|nr:MAG: hypothetical protein UU14_C0027G0015 [Candidatus Roizmanbacteria bacterium GW2011_GWB1_40_7]KKR93302.1 MAG: hypothetical protein UU41_C0021G0015 [Candidatus Roizmanbacteria bacterium GW2011_GWA1_41_13]KKS23358.1 MAG: hypothetical protein UU81_C0031G0002 [Microgenomates group bacterium GW2011_GWC1_41_8]OGK47754.1 MAG: hypothetical protein A3A55_02255 [Candidatus Roizmanbacteria bacterium RIFCSPLOWO2_01_FULL_40_14]
MLSETRVLSGEVGAIPGAIFIMGTTRFMAIEVKSGGSVEVIPVSINGEFDLESGPRIISGDIEVFRYSSSTGSEKTNQ